MGMKKLIIGIAFLVLSICLFWLSNHYHQLDVQQDNYKEYMQHIIEKAVVFHNYKTRVILSFFVSLCAFIISLLIIVKGLFEIRKRNQK
jgi:uncharacterized membrane protein YbaN (DUF454 family)